MLGMVRSKYLPAGLHGCEGAAISVSALGSFRSAVARAVWFKKLPMTNTPALLSLLMALGDLIRLSSSFGVVFVSSVVILRTVLMMRLAFLVFWIMPLLDPRGMGPSIFFFSLLKNFVFSGILSRLVGFGLVCLRCV